MKHFYVFVLRAILSAAFAVLLARMFFHDTDPVRIAVLGLFMFAAAYLAKYLRMLLSAAAYLTEYLRNRKSKQKTGEKQN